MSDAGRRPIKTRSKGWAQGLASSLASRGVRPDVISIWGLVFALAGTGALAAASVLPELPYRWLLLVGAALFIQLRLLANMLDGLVAVEGGRSGPLGNLFNEFPDRLEDVMLIVAAGYVAARSQWPGGEVLGWSAAVLALLVAYVRALAAGIGGGHPFHGPMAKPQRMFLLTLACLAGAALASSGWAEEAVWVGLATMVFGMLITIPRRLAAVAKTLRQGDQR
ncbi:MAG: CDP-alcohol phosphatidyltransferase family protein [Rhodothermales bacterium]|nr:CDP-alcohol phosphatidyltransferase family protein [Rhodothermales bacterium]